MSRLCTNIFCSSKNDDGTCGALDLDGDRTEWCSTLAEYLRFKRKTVKRNRCPKCKARGVVLCIRCPKCGTSEVA